MAVPPSVTVKDLSGTYDMNKTISDSSLPILQMQGVSWLVQQVARFGSVQIVLKHYTDEKGDVHIDQESTSTGYIKSEELRILTNEWSEKTDAVWGHIRSQSRYIKLTEVEDAWLKGDWETAMDGDAIETYAESLTDNNWTARQVWGFAEVDGERRHMRRILAKKGEEEYRVRLVYDWTEKPQTEAAEDQAYDDDDEMNPSV